MPTITDEEWEDLKELGKKLPPIPENLDLKMTRKILQSPYALEFFFDGYRKDLKEKIGHGDEMKSTISNLACSDDVRSAFSMMIFLHTRSLEMFKDHLDMIEALSFQNTELRKDLNKLIRLTKPTKNKNKELDNFLKQLSIREKKNTKFAKDYEQKLPYVNQFKDFLDHEAINTEHD